MRNLFLGIVLITFYVIACCNGAPQPPHTHQADDAQVEQLPNYEDPIVQKKLACSACKSLTLEFQNKLLILRKLRHGKPKYYEVAAEIEGVCKSVKDQYGLLMKNNKPTMDFSKNPAISRLRGNWIDTFLENRCNELLDQHEEELLKSYHSTTVEEFRSLICRESAKLCSVHDLNKEEL
eukprot:PhF_6_TR19739/c0_g1_i1/m.28805